MTLPTLNISVSSPIIKDEYILKKNRSRYWFISITKHYMGVDLRTWPKDPTKPPQFILAKTNNERGCTLQMKQFDFECHTLKVPCIISYPYLYKTGLSPTVIYFTDQSKGYFFLWIICDILPCVCHAFASVHFCLVITRWERADFQLSFVMFNCVFVTFPCDILI